MTNNDSEFLARLSRVKIVRIDCLKRSSKIPRARVVYEDKEVSLYRKPWANVKERLTFDEEIYQLVGFNRYDLSKETLDRLNQLYGEFCQAIDYFNESLKERHLIDFKLELAGVLSKSPKGFSKEHLVEVFNEVSVLRVLDR